MNIFKMAIPLLVIGITMPVTYAEKKPLLTVKPSVNKKTNCYCQPGDFQAIAAKAKIYLEFPKNTRKKKRQNSKQVYAAPACWSISDSSYILKQKLGPLTYGWSETPANFKLIRKDEFTEIQKSLNKYLIEASVDGKTKAKIAADLQETLETYQSEAIDISGSHSTITHVASIQGAGYFNGRTIYEGYANVVLKCVPSILTDADSLEEALRLRIDESVKNSPQVKPHKGYNGVPQSRGSVGQTMELPRIR